MNAVFYVSLKKLNYEYCLRTNSRKSDWIFNLHICVLSCFIQCRQRQKTKFTTSTFCARKNHDLDKKVLQAICLSQEKYINDFSIFTFSIKRLYFPFLQDNFGRNWEFLHKKYCSLHIIFESDFSNEWSTPIPLTLATRQKALTSFFIIIQKQ